jgi:hypothetical protein
MLTSQPAPPAPAVARWKRDLIAARGACMQPEPNPADPRDVTAYTEAVRQLAADARTGIEPHGRPTVCLGAEAELELP